jgi:hypothetical protein
MIEKDLAINLSLERSQDPGFISPKKVRIFATYVGILLGIYT